MIEPQGKGCCPTTCARMTATDRFETCVERLLNFPVRSHIKLPSIRIISISVNSRSLCARGCLQYCLLLVSTNIRILKLHSLAKQPDEIFYLLSLVIDSLTFIPVLS